METRSRSPLLLLPAIVIPAILLFSILTWGVSQLESRRPAILPLPVKATSLPLLSEALRDPAILADAQMDDFYADGILVEIKDNKQDLKTAKGKARAFLLKEVFEKQAYLTYYLTDVAGGAAYSEGGIMRRAGSLQKIRQDAIATARAWATASQRKSDKARALYFIFSEQYLAGSKTSALKGFRRIHKNLNPALKNRVNLLVNLHKLNGSKRKAALKRLTRLAKKLPAAGKVAAGLAVARSQAGLNQQGKRVRNPVSGYRRSLYKATSRAGDFSAGRKEAVLGFAIATWRGAVGSHASWDKAPIALKHYGEQQSSRALIERQAMAKAQRGDFSAAIRMYTALSGAYTGSETMLRLDRRIVDLEYQKFRRSKNVSPYEKSLATMKQKYSDSQILGKGKEAPARQAKADFHGRYLRLVNSMLTVAQKPATGSKLRRQAIGLGLRFVDGLKNKQEKTRVLDQIATIYALDKQHGKAVTLWSALAEDSRGNARISYLNKALRSQRILARWPASPPWDQRPAGDAGQRQKLSALYERLLQASGDEARWDLLAQTGLLRMVNGQGEQAFDLWEKGLNKDPRGNHAARAAGLMLQVRYKTKNWQKVEELARLCLKKGLQPRTRSKVLAATTYLADALYFGGKELLANGKYAGAVKKLKEFTKRWPGDKRRHDAVFALAIAYHGDKQHKLAVETLMAFSEQYPSSSHRQRALRLGGTWSVDMAWEEPAIYFFQRYLNQYKTAEDSGQIRSTLLDLYMGKELWGSAARLHKETILTSPSREARLKSALAYMEIEERFGDINKATWGAKKVLEYSGDDPDNRAVVLGFQARQVHKRRDARALFDLQTIEGALARLNTDSYSVTDNLAMVRFMIAGRKATGNKKEIFNLGLKNPGATLEKHYAIFASSRKDFNAVCDAGASSWCSPAMFSLARSTTDTIQTIEDLTIQEILPEAEVLRFNKRKQAIILTLANVAEKSDSKAREMVNEGRNTPLWARDIVFETSRDWNFENVSGESGSGYMQWTTTRENQED